MRILFFSPKECLPANTGARLRNYHLSKELSRRAEVTYLGFSEEMGSPEKVLNESSSWGPQKVILVPRDKGYTAGKLLRGAVGRQPLTVLNYTTERMAARLRQVLDESEFDVVQMESLLLCHYIPIIRSARRRPLLVCDWHNIDSEVMKRYSHHQASLAPKLYAKLTSRRLESLEKASLNNFDAHLTVSERDRQKLLSFGSTVPIEVIHNGVDTNFFYPSSCHRVSALETNKTDKPMMKRRVLFVGSMDYHANIDAVTTFARDIWVNFYNQNPQFTFTIVGRNPTPSVRRLAELPGIEVTGTVSDVRPYYQEAFASVVPLRIGGGSRLKILESMAAGVPVISTRLGAEGIEISDKENILMAESKEDFQNSLLALQSQIGLGSRISTGGLKLVQANFDWGIVGKKVFEMFETLTIKEEVAGALSKLYLSKTAEVVA